MTTKMHSYRTLLLISVFICLLVACSNGGVETPATSVAEDTPLPIESPEPLPSDTPLQPTPTSMPLVARVNGEGIPLAEYRAELNRYQAAVGRELTEEDELLVLNDMISNLLLARAALEAGYELDEETLQTRLEDLINAHGGEGAFLTWLETNQYDSGSFREALARSIRAAWMRDQITSAVPTAGEQVHLRQVLVPTLQEAEEVIRRLEAGADFETIASEYDLATGGYLGWAPRGYLLEPAVEDAAFALEVGQFSAIIESEIGYHILYLIERESERPLAADALRILQGAALQDWVTAAREGAEIEILSPLDG